MSLVGERILKWWSPQFISDCISFDGFDFIAKYKMVPHVSVLLEVIFFCLYVFKSKYTNLTFYFSRKLTFIEFKIHKRQHGMGVFSSGKSRLWGMHCEERLSGFQDRVFRLGKLRKGAAWRCGDTLGFVVSTLTLNKSEVMGNLPVLHTSADPSMKSILL